MYITFSKTFPVYGNCSLLLKALRNRQFYSKKSLESTVVYHRHHIQPTQYTRAESKSSLIPEKINASATSLLSPWYALIPSASRRVRGEKKTRGSPLLALGSAPVRIMTLQITRVGTRDFRNARARISTILPVSRYAHMYKIRTENPIRGNAGELISRLVDGAHVYTVLLLLLLLLLLQSCMEITHRGCYAYAMRRADVER